MTQTERILTYLQEHKTISQREAIDLFGCYRLGARIFEIRELGFSIKKEMEKGVNRFGEPVYYARYCLEGGKRE